MTQTARRTDNDKQVFSLGQERHLSLDRLTSQPWLSYNSGKAQMLTDLSKFKKAEVVDATPQDLSTVLRWAGGMRVLAGPATLD